MQRKILISFLIAFVFAGVVYAASSVTGPQVEGGTWPGYPVAMGLKGADGNIHGVSGSNSGILSFNGTATPDSSTNPGNPFVIAGEDTSGNVRIPNVTPDGNSYSGSPRTLSIGALTSASTVRALRSDPSFNLSVTEGLNFLTDPIVRVNKVASTGTSPVTLVSGSGGKLTYISTLLITNKDTVTHGVTLQGTTSGTTFNIYFVLATLQSAIIDGRGDWRTDSGDGLQLVLDEAGTTVFTSGACVQK